MMDSTNNMALNPCVTLSDVVQLEVSRKRKTARRSAGSFDGDDAPTTLFSLGESWGTKLKFVPISPGHSDLLRAGLILLLEKTRRSASRSRSSAGTATACKSSSDGKNERQSLHRSPSANSSAMMGSLDYSMSTTAASQYQPLSSLTDAKLNISGASYLSPSEAGSATLSTADVVDHANILQDIPLSPQSVSTTGNGPRLPPPPQPEQRPNYTHGRKIIRTIVSNALVPLSFALCRVLVLDSTSPVNLAWHKDRGDTNVSTAPWKQEGGDTLKGASEHKILSRPKGLAGATRTLSYDRPRYGSMIRLSETRTILQDTGTNSETHGMVLLALSEHSPRRGFSTTVIMEIKSSCANPSNATQLSITAEITPVGQNRTNEAAIHKAFLLVTEELQARYGTDGSGLISQLLKVADGMEARGQRSSSPKREANGSFPTNPRQNLPVSHRHSATTEPSSMDDNNALSSSLVPNGPTRVSAAAASSYRGLSPFQRAPPQNTSIAMPRSSSKAQILKHQDAVHCLSNSEGEALSHPQQHHLSNPFRRTGPTVPPPGEYSVVKRSFGVDTKDQGRFIGSTIRPPRSSLDMEGDEVSKTLFTPLPTSNRDNPIDLVPLQDTLGDQEDDSPKGVRKSRPSTPSLLKEVPENKAPPPPKISEDLFLTAISHDEEEDDDQWNPQPTHGAFGDDLDNSPDVQSSAVANPPPIQPQCIQVKPLPKIRLSLLPSPREQDEDEEDSDDDDKRRKKKKKHSSKRHKQKKKTASNDDERLLSSPQQQYSSSRLVL